MPTEFEPIFLRLKAILQKHAGGALSVGQDTPTTYGLKGGVHPTHKIPMPIAWVNIGKGYVSYHLMPVYACPKLLDGLSAKLKARMQGKSCFNFKAIDEPLFQELEQLTAAGIAAFAKPSFMQATKTQPKRRNK